MKRRQSFVPILLLLTMFATMLFPGLAVANNDQQTGFATPIFVVNTSFLNVRTGPGAQFSVLTTVTGGTELPVLGTAGDSVWYQVSTPVGVGWINVEFALARGDFTNVPLVKVNVPTSNPVIIAQPVVVPSVPVVSQQQGSVPQAQMSGSSVASSRVYRAVPIGGAVNVYRSPSVNSGAVTTLIPTDMNTDYAIVGRAMDGEIPFLAIDIPGFGTAWIEESKIATRLAKTTDLDVVVVTADVAAMTFGPGGGNDGKLPILTRGWEAYVTNVSPDARFIELELADGTRGWVSFDSVRPRTGTTTDINPVPAPSMVSVPPAVAQPGMVMPSLEQGGGPNDLLVIPVPIPQPVVSQSKAIVNTSFLNIRSGPGAQYTVVFTARGGTELTVLGIAADGVWFLVQGPSGQGWVNNEFVIFRGDIEGVPIIRNASGVIETPVVVIGSSVQLYAAPGTNFGLLGSIAGPVEAPIVARTPNFDWIQINTSAGFGWVLASQVAVRGDANLIPVVNN